MSSDMIHHPQSTAVPILHHTLLPDTVSQVQGRRSTATRERIPGDHQMQKVVV